MAILPIGEYPQKLLWQILLVGVQTEMCVSLTENRREAEYGTGIYAGKKQCERRIYAAI